MLRKFMVPLALGALVLGVGTVAAADANHPTQSEARGAVSVLNNFIAQHPGAGQTSARNSLNNVSNFVNNHPDVTTTTAGPTTTAGTTTTTAQPSTTGASCTGMTFCETFDSPSGGASRSGTLNGTLWGVSRLNYDVNSHETWAGPTPVGCNGGPDVQVCNGMLHEAMYDREVVANLSMYPKQPFDFAGRTGTIVFDVSDDTQGTHGAWPELWVSDKPNPTPTVFEGGSGPQPANGFGLRFYGSEIEAAIVRNYAQVDSFTNQSLVQQDQGFVESNGVGQVNHFEVHVSQGRIDVFGTDARNIGQPYAPLKHLATVNNANLTLTRGLVWIEDQHYNADKFGSQGTHTFVWDNLGFDGPRIARDIAVDVPDATPSENGPLAYGPLPVTLHTDSVPATSGATGGLVTFEWYVWDTSFVPSFSLNGGPVHTTAPPWPDGQTFIERSIAVPVPAAEIHQGVNTITFTTSNGAYAPIVHNVDVILVGAGG